MKIALSEISVTQHGAGDDAAPCLELAGRFDAFETPRFRSAVESLIAADASTIWVDMSSIAFVDSSALAELVRSHKRCRELGGELVIVSPSDPVTVIFELTRLDAAFRIESDRSTAEVA